MQDGIIAPLCCFSISFAGSKCSYLLACCQKCVCLLCPTEVVWWEEIPP